MQRGRIAQLWVKRPWVEACGGEFETSERETTGTKANWCLVAKLDYAEGLLYRVIGACQKRWSSGGMVEKCLRVAFSNWLWVRVAVIAFARSGLGRENLFLVDTGAAAECIQCRPHVVRKRETSALGDAAKVVVTSHPQARTSN